VSTSHRRHELYINIIKYLSPEFKIGIIKFESQHRWGNIEEAYLRMCQDVGGLLVENTAECSILILPRFGGKKGAGYYKCILEDMPKRISWKKVFYDTVIYSV
jgi:hypothetical protein